MNTKLKTIKCAFVQTIPVLMGYTTMGAAFGILLNKAGFHPIWAFFMSLTILSGSLQFAAVPMLMSKISLAETALLSFIINIRYAMYGLSLLKPFQNISFFKRSYMIFCLADEAYALEVQDDRPSDVKREDFMFYIGFFDHLYWIAGSTIGAIAGSCVEFNSQGIEFAMTALFLVILIEQSWNKDNRKPIFIGLIATVISLLIFGAAKMLIPAMLFFIGGLLLFRKKIEVKEQEDNEL